MKSFKKFVISERVWYDKIATIITKNLFHKDYEHALKALVDMIERKRSTGMLRHDIEYYANAIAKSYRSVDGYELADMYKELFPKTKRG